MTTFLLERRPDLDGAAAFIPALLGAVSFFAINALLTALLVSLRTGQEYGLVLLGDARGFATSMSLGLAPLGWLMAQMYTVAWWASLLFVSPCT